MRRALLGAAYGFALGMFTRTALERFEDASHKVRKPRNA